MFERSLKLSLHIPKRFDVFQVLKWFSFLLHVACAIFARATNTDVGHVRFKRGFLYCVYL